MLPDRPGDAPARRHDRVVLDATCRAGTRSRSRGYHIREAGSTAAQELAFTLKDGLTYVEQAIERGLDVDDFAPRLSFFFNAQIDFFEEIAKYRAARRIWARELRETFGAKNPRSWLMRFHTQTAGVSLTAQQPLNNIVRTAIEALAGVLGGTQSLHTNSYDEALALPTEDAVRIALRTQQIIAHETGVANTDRPARRQLLRRGADRPSSRSRPTTTSRRIDELGGMVEAVKQNFPQREIADAASSCRQEIDAGERIVVGVNAFTRRRRRPARRSCASTPRSSASRSAACRPSAPGATRPRSSALAALRDDGRAATSNLMPACSTAPALTRREGEIVEPSRTSAARTRRHPSSEGADLFDEEAHRACRRCRRHRRRGRRSRLAATTHRPRGRQRLPPESMTVKRGDTRPLPLGRRRAAQRRRATSGPEPFRRISNRRSGTGLAPADPPRHAARSVCTDPCRAWT